jgi:two-component system, chemotaxis family, protein-glutamate methylesterase/glutaminase
MDFEDKVRILIVDDAITYRRIIGDVLADVPGVEVVGTAANGRIALQKIEQLRPDLLTLDLEMPDMDGLEVLRRLTEAGGQVQAIMLSGATSYGADLTVAALKLGAFDFVIKPAFDSLEKNSAFLRQELGQKVQAFARSKHIRTILHGAGLAPHHTSTRPVPSNQVAKEQHSGARRGLDFRIFKPEVVALGISTGGPASLTQMLPRLPANLGVPVLIVQHMPPVFTKSLADDLNRRCALRVYEASDGQLVRPGEILIAPGGKQMKVESRNGQITVAITNDPPENSCRPSVDYLFRSVCEVYGRNAIGVIMTGMGNDGTRGCREMKRQGAAIIAQDEPSCVVFGMPKGPIDEGIADVIAPLDELALEIVRLAGKGVGACV